MFNPKVKLLDQLDHEYRDLDTLEDSQEYYRQDLEATKAMRECGFKVRSYKLKNKYGRFNQ